jgi:hypothetical protein
VVGEQLVRGFQDPSARTLRGGCFPAGGHPAE